VNPVYSAEADEYREVVRSFLNENLPTGWRGLWALDFDERETFVDQWREKLVANRFFAPSWPAKYGGGGLSPVERIVLAEEFAKVGAPMQRESDSGGLHLLGPTLLAVGTEEQKDYFLPRIISGEDRWAQGYSEPEAGSDLASVRTRAELIDGKWIINGQKVWTSLAHDCNWIFMLCRTDTSVSKTRGISFLLVPLDQPGIEIRPLINIVGTHEFNETFFTDAETSEEMIVGEPNGGWSVANTLLGAERTSTLYAIMYQDELDRMIEAAKERGLTSDPLIRQRIAWCYSKVEVLRCLGMKALTRQLEGWPSGPESSLLKVLSTEYRKKALDLMVDIMGLEATTPTGRKPYYCILPDARAEYSSAGWVDMYLGSQPGTVYAGTSEIQRNIIGERVLGLPREPKVERSPANA
jgi:alkylation response protein AidB-like acyl-CoA dehydrogenase